MFVVPSSIGNTLLLCVYLVMHDVVRVVLTVGQAPLYWTSLVVKFNFDFLFFF